MVQDCNGAGVAEDDDVDAIMAGPIMGSSGAEFMQRIAIFEEPELGSDDPTMTSLADMEVPISTYAEIPVRRLPV
jgi:hypothetical protein